MKKFLLLFFMLASTVAFAQCKYTTNFLGITVDGSKKDMIKKLEAKGYKYDPSLDFLKGEYNGEDIFIKVVTNNNKVYRIVVGNLIAYSESEVKERFNKLYHQFENDPRYISNGVDRTIPEDTDISNEMTVNDKEFQAAYYQKINGSDTLAVRDIGFAIYRKTLEEHPMDSITAKSLTEEELEKIHEKLIENAYQLVLQELESYMEIWFAISKYDERYFLAVYYDNRYNEANSEDL